VSIKTLHEETASLTFNQLAIESTRRLVQSIINNECKGLKDFFKPEMVAQEKEPRSASHGQLCTLQGVYIIRWDFDEDFVFRRVR
jgi:hypothetical protein